MRGKEDFWSVSYQSSGITPAYAGKSLVHVDTSATNKDHPRVCGEKCELVFSLVTLLGSPPRMRGKVEEVTPTNETDRITPAYAGKRLCCRVGSRVTGDHPRVCGEKCQPGPRSPGWAGSPPRMRGKAPLALGHGHQPWITPAYAGKRFSAPLGGGKKGDHPRVCGEKSGHFWRGGIQMGSPPRMRGKETQVAEDEAPEGITPAYAGKRNMSGHCGRRTWDHPRVCGEKTIEEIAVTQAVGITPAYAGKRLSKKLPLLKLLGSPPRMRGKEFRQPDFLPPDRITPAYAGKSCCSRKLLQRFRDHPRVCGEKNN